MQKLHDAIGRAVARVLTLDREDGQGAVEYALVVLGVVTILGVTIAGFTGQISGFMTAVGNALSALAP